eukprot:TRINITY_DN9750_c1_g1_i1.p1 TRINITY_DN9750_c1_g1~~TRINITY_DN9750_c1_g1_i1.p1  ORF type:complete len:479 (+),score=99.87 TRINITY_DN9750_c1_g1_i1:274-1710(+)
MTGGGGNDASYPLCEGTIDQVKYIPVRLTIEERKRQRLLRAAVSASRYTDVVDTPANEKRRLTTILKEQYNLYLGTYVADVQPMERGLQMCGEPELSRAEGMITTLFELSRRYKVMNPETMRCDYGKLLFIMQDSVREEVKEQLGFNPMKPIVTVHSRAVELGVEDLLSEPELALATTPVPRLSRIQNLNVALRKKDKTVARLVAKYARRGSKLEDKVEQLIRSIDDANCYIRDNSDTISAMITELKMHFSPHSAEPGLALAISEGVEGSRLSHEHEKQYHFVLQSLTLWKNITKHMYKLWLLMEVDLLSEDNPYSLEDTGQGFNRKQQAPQLYDAMQGILEMTKQEVSVWVGSDKVHIGDHQVPNGYNFIEKYTQTARIINPILKTVQAIDTIAKDPEHLAYIKDVWATPEVLKKSILCDFFRHGFDGSGGDNDMDAGSCIDGRLTSAWHWCSSIKGKPFYPIFLLAGFGSFDGDFT